MRARFYDAVDGRFISRDPIGELGDLNFYRYCLNRPVTFIDALGLLIMYPKDIVLISESLSIIRTTEVGRYIYDELENSPYIFKIELAVLDPQIYGKTILKKEPLFGDLFFIQKPLGTEIFLNYLLTTNKMSSLSEVYSKIMMVLTLVHELAHSYGVVKFGKLMDENFARKIEMQLLKDLNLFTIENLINIYLRY